MEQFRIYLKEKELSPATIEKYVHDVAAFQKWAGEEDIAFTKEKLCGWKDYLLSQNYAKTRVPPQVCKDTEKQLHKGGTPADESRI